MAKLDAMEQCHDILLEKENAKKAKSSCESSEMSGSKMSDVWEDIEDIEKE